jgi:glycine dehydrogenase subunit 1
MRYLPLTPKDRAAMLQRIGVAHIDDLFVDVPAAARLDGAIKGLPSHLPEHEVARHITALAAENIAAGSCPSFLGAGFYRHHVPASVDQLILRGEFLTSYTPYQPEVSQGTLQMLFEFQTLVAQLLGMEVANASMYDGATACAEAVMMANRLTKRRRALISGNVHPHDAEVTLTQARLTDFVAEWQAPAPENPAAAIKALIAKIDETVACVVVALPDFFGHLQDYSALAAAAQAKGALLIVTVREVVALGLIQPPGAMGADIVVGEGQSLGNGLNFGGPSLGLFACREKFIRQMPGRLCGETVDAAGQRGFVLTLSTREQHIRRDKATSNICTNSGLCALAFTIHAALLGEMGLRRLARINHAKAQSLVKALTKLPQCRVLNSSYFNEIVLALSVAAAPIVEALAKLPLLAGVPVARLHPTKPELENLLLLAVSEMTTEADIEFLVTQLEAALRTAPT